MSVMFFTSTLCQNFAIYPALTQRHFSDNLCFAGAYLAVCVYRHNNIFTHGSHFKYCNVIPLSAIIKAPVKRGHVYSSTALFMRIIIKAIIRHSNFANSVFIFSVIV